MQRQLDLVIKAIEELPANMIKAMNDDVEAKKLLDRKEIEDQLRRLSETNRAICEAQVAVPFTTMPGSLTAKVKK